MASKKAIAIVCKQLEYLHGKPISKASLEIWQQVLAPLSDSLLERATMILLREETESFVIMPGAIYQTALKLMKQESSSPGEAWSRLSIALDAIVERKGWDAFQALPEEIQVAARQVGMRGLIDARHLVADRARFLEFYQAVVTKQAEASLLLSSHVRESKAIEGRNNSGTVERLPVGDERAS